MRGAFFREANDERSTFFTKKPSSFLAAFMWGGSAVLVTLILAVTGVAIYGVNVVDRRTDNVFSLIEEVVENLPNLKKILPAAVVDAFEDHREPSYVGQLDIGVELVTDDTTGRHRPVVSVTNRGSETVSLLHLRVVAVDEKGRVLAERATYAATPLAMEDEWRGPLMPDATRRFSLASFAGDRAADVSWEITDVRVWNPSAGTVATSGGRSQSCGGAVQCPGNTSMS